MNQVHSAVIKALLIKLMGKCKSLSHSNLRVRPAQHTTF